MAKNGEKQQPTWERIHDEACAKGEMYYLDPDTGYRVFTRLALESRGKCCDCKCRHCPYRISNL